MSKTCLNGSTTFGKENLQEKRRTNVLRFQRKRSRKIYTDDDDDFLFEEVLNRGQRWQIEDKLENPQLFRGNFVNSLKSEGKKRKIFS